MYMRIPVSNRRNSEAGTRGVNGTVLHGTMLSLEADSPVASITCSLEARRRRVGEIPLRGFFVAQEEGRHLGLGVYRLRLDDGRQGVVSVDHLTPLASQAKQLGSFEIVSI
jgi:hypothetical protein